MRRFFSFGWGILSVGIIVGLVFGVLASAMAADYYKGQTITFIVPNGAGGGADVWARYIGNHLGRFIPGKPTVVIRNMPAAAGLIAANLAWYAKPDGKTLLFVIGKTNIGNMLRPRGTEYYLDKMHPLYASPFGVVFYFKPGLVPQPKDIVNTKGLIFAHDPPTGGVSILWIFAKAFLGFESKDVLGYIGGGDARLAFLTGEANVTGAGSDSYVTNFKGEIERGTAVGLFQSGLLDADGNVARESHLPPIPTPKEIYEQVYGKAPSGPAWGAYKALVGARACDNSIVMPPTTKPEHVSIMRKAFEDMAKDQQFLKEGEFLAKGASHIVGATLIRSFTRGISGNAENIDFLKKYLVEKYNVRFDS